MVKKLIKHEFVYYLRTLGLFMPLVLLLGLMVRVFQLLENGSTITRIALVSSGFMCYMGAIALVIVTTLLYIIRFYQNLFSAEGYLTFTLPITNRQHIFVKLLAAASLQLIGLLVIGLTAVIALPWNWISEIIRVIGLLFSWLWQNVDPIHLVLYIIELLLILAVGLISTPLQYYSCIAIGQTAKKNRILLAIGVYFGYYMVSQTLATVSIMIFSFLGAAGAMDGIFYFFTENPYVMIHLGLLLLLAVGGALTWLFYTVTLRIMNTKLNLE